MIYRIFEAVDRLWPLERASAHCDVPCGIYDPISAQLAALSVLRFMDQLAELDASGDADLAARARLSRLVQQKEEHAEKVKQEVRVIWGDYFKDEQLAACPDTPELTHRIMRLASSCKQGVSQEDARTLVALCNDFANNFWKTKGVKTFEATCPYPPAVTVVYPALGGA
ncbi:MAG: superoxide dismutase, Ni [Pseudomonadota bacterium]